MRNVRIGMDKPPPPIGAANHNGVIARKIGNRGGNFSSGIVCAFAAGDARHGRIIIRIRVLERELEEICTGLLRQQPRRAPLVVPVLENK